MSDNLALGRWAENSVTPHLNVNDIAEKIDAVLSNSRTLDFTAGNLVLTVAHSQDAALYIVTNMVQDRQLTLPATRRLMKFDLTGIAAALTLSVVKGTTIITLAGGAAWDVYSGAGANDLSKLGGGGSGSGGASLPTQAGNAGKVLKTDGTAPYWAEDLQGSGGGSGGTGGTPAPNAIDVSSTHWRVFCRRGSGYFAYAIAEIQFLDSNAVAIPTTGATITAAGANDPAANAFDGNPATFWSHTATTSSEIQNSDSWIGVAFTSAKTVRGVKLTARNSGSLAERQVPLVFELQYSANGGVTWATYNVFYNGTYFGVGETRTYVAQANPYAGLSTTFRKFAPAGAHLRWRLEVYNNVGLSLSTRIQELIFRDVDGNEISTAGATITATSTASGSNISNAFDKNNATFWRSNNAPSTSAPQTIEVVFPQPVAIAEIALSTTDNVDGGPRDFSVTYSDSGQAWWTTWRVNGAGPYTDGTMVRYISPFIVNNFVGGLFNPPLAASFPTIVDGTGALAPVLTDDANIGLNFLWGPANATDKVKAAFKPLPDSDWQVEAGFRHNWPFANYFNAGLWFRRMGAGGNAMCSLGRGTNNTLNHNMVRFNQAGTAVAGGTVNFFAQAIIAVARYYRIRYTKATDAIATFASEDGKNFFGLAAGTGAALVGGQPDQIGIGIHMANTTAGSHISMTCDYWNQSW